MPYFNYDFIPLYVSLAVSAVLAALAVWKKALTVSATVVAVLIMVGISAFTGYAGLVAFGVSFVGAVVIGFVGKRKREEREADVHARKGARGVVQVLANSLPSFILGLIWFVTGKTCFLVGSVTAVTAGFADSAASDVGILSDGKVINIVTFKPQPRGLSGGVSLLGTVAALVASTTVAAAVFAVGGIGAKSLPVVALVGFMGTIIDSVLGGSVQAKYKCSSCGILTERKEHCGAPTELASGCRFIDNNAVNFIASCVAGGVAALIAYFAL